MAPALLTASLAFLVGSLAYYFANVDRRRLRELTRECERLTTQLANARTINADLRLVVQVVVASIVSLLPETQRFDLLHKLDRALERDQEPTP